MRTHTVVEKLGKELKEGDEVWDDLGDATFAKISEGTAENYNKSAGTIMYLVKVAQFYPPVPDKVKFPDEDDCGNIIDNINTYWRTDEITGINMDISKALKEYRQITEQLNPEPVNAIKELTNEKVEKWFTENIAADCSASSAIFKFRLWLIGSGYIHSKGEWISVEKWKMKDIDNTLRVVSNTIHANTKETALDRMVCQSKEFTEEALKNNPIN